MSSENAKTLAGTSVFDTATSPNKQVNYILPDRVGCCDGCACGCRDGALCGVVIDVDRAVSVRYEALRRSDSASPYQIPQEARR